METMEMGSAGVRYASTQDHESGSGAPERLGIQCKIVNLETYNKCPSGLTCGKAVE